MTKGWKQDSLRHSLARKGVKSSNNLQSNTQTNAIPNFKLVEKTYKDETYESEPFLRDGRKIKARVDMHYHTTRHYWHVNYEWLYGERFGWTSGIIKGETYLDRKKARAFAMKYIKDAKKSDIELLEDSEFRKKCILESG